jgi:hypothetical protein
MKGRPRIANNDAERCQALTVMTEWKRRSGREQRCGFEAKYSVEDKRLCRHHAVQEVFAIGLEKGLIKRIVVPRTPGQRVTIAEDA